MKENKTYYVCKSMKELLAYTKAKRKQRAHQHYEMAKVYGECSGMGNRLIAARYGNKAVRS